MAGARDINPDEANDQVVHSHFSIGWDVGGWNCDRNRLSRDAVVIIDGNLKLVGRPWRGNLRTVINSANSTRDWLLAVFKLCGTEETDPSSRVTMAIDTPLGFSEGFRALVNGLQAEPQISGESEGNPYLYRQTERFLFERGWKPLSPVKDMIGSQATKGMHALRKFAPKVARCGVWTDGASFQAIEAYPTVCRQASTIHTLRKGFGPMPHADCEDALICALLAHLFATSPGSLEAPGKDIPAEEGWIWVPKG